MTQREFSSCEAKAAWLLFQDWEAAHPRLMRFIETPVLRHVVFHVRLWQVQRRLERIYGPR